MRRRYGARRVAASLAVAAVLAAVALAIAGRPLWRGAAPRPSFRQLTFRRGPIWSARFAPDGRTVVYGAAWDGRPIGLFSTLPDGPESRPFGVGADVLSISRTGEIAVSLDRQVVRLWESEGRLARMPIAGGAPRDIIDSVKDADWSPDGSAMAIVRRVNGRDRLEFPIGTVLYETQGYLVCPRVAKDGAAVAFLQRQNGDESVEIVDLSRRRTTLASGAHTETGMAWAPDGNEVIFTVFAGGSTKVQAVTRSGKRRLVTDIAGAWKLHDISGAGRALLTQDHIRGQVIGVSLPDGRERDLSLFDLSAAVDLSSDGSLVLLAEAGAAGGESRAAYLRRFDGSPAVRLGDGQPEALSPDGKWAILNQGFAPERLVLVPTGPGSARALENGPVTDYYRVRWLPGGTQIAFRGVAPGDGVRNYIQDLGGGPPRPLSWSGAIPAAAFLAGGKTYVTRGQDGRFYVFDTGASAPRAVAPIDRRDYLLGATADGRGVYAMHAGAASATIYRVELPSGVRETWKAISIPDPAGVMPPGPEFQAVLISADGRSCVYSFLRVLSDLFLAERLQ